MEKTFQRNQEVEAAPLDEESILYDPGSSKFFMLNSTSAFIWEQLATPVTVEGIATAIGDAFEEITPEGALSDVRDTVDELVSMDLVAVVGDS